MAKVSVLPLNELKSDLGRTVEVLQQLTKLLYNRKCYTSGIYSIFFSQQNYYYFVSQLFLSLQVVSVRTAEGLVRRWSLLPPLWSIRGSERRTQTPPCIATSSSFSSQTSFRGGKKKRRRSRDGATCAHIPPPHPPPAPVSQTLANLNNNKTVRKQHG